MNYEEKYNELVERTIDVLTYDIDSPYGEEAHNTLLYDLCEEKGYEIDTDDMRRMICGECEEYLVKADRRSLEDYDLCLTCAEKNLKERGATDEELKELIV
tara:strand:+ start:2868 stop:3170 length:303 start_codon:yes stop_codon:yes gene_type:complete